MSHRTQMIRRNRCGVSSAKLNYMELMRQGNDSLSECRLAEIHDRSCEKLITCSKTVVIQRSLLLHSQMAERVNFFMHLYMLVSITKLRKKQRQPKLISLLLVDLLMEKGLMIIWHLLQRFTVYVETGAVSENILQ